MHCKHCKVHILKPCGSQLHHLVLQVSSTMEMPSLSEFLLTAADLLNLHLSARLVVISSSHTRDQHGWATSDGIVTLTRALLVAGAQCVLICLWPVPDTATKILLRAFYSALLQVSDQFACVSCSYGHSVLSVFLCIRDYCVHKQ